MNGRFPQLGNFGYGSQSDANFANDAIASSLIGSYYYPYSSSGGLNMADTSNPTACGKYGTVYVYLNATTLGFSPSVAAPSGNSSSYLNATCI